MADSAEQAQPTHARFQETHWSLVLAAGNSHSSTAQGALELLCQRYWPPIYAFVRRRGYSPEDAQDLTQEFFAAILARNSLTQLTPDKGKFRTFLLACLENFLANDWRKRQTIKRGGGMSSISLDLADAELSLEADLSSALSPERIFDRRWAATVLEHGITQLRNEWLDQGKGELFEAFREFLAEPAGPGGYDSVAARLKMAPGTVATHVHRLRQRYRDLVRATLAQTVTTPLELEEEMRYLLEVCG